MGTQSNNMNWKTERVDEICKNSIWREHLGKESSNSVLNENFRLNPRTMISITDKPGQVNPNLPPPRKKALKDIDETQQALNQALSDACLSPRGKYKEPQTANMEYGWMPDPLCPRVSSSASGKSLAKSPTTRRPTSNRLASRHSLTRAARCEVVSETMRKQEE